MEILPKLAEEARKRQEQQGKYGLEGGRGHKKETLPPLLAEGFNSDSRDQAAKLLNVSHSYVDCAKKITTAAPEKIAEIRAGKKTIPRVVRELIYSPSRSMI